MDQSGSLELYLIPKIKKDKGGQHCSDNNMVII